jgi:hypothetical protein
VGEFKAQEHIRLLRIKDDAAKRIQARIRGILSRKWFQKNIAQLKKQRRLRAYCVECETVIATRRCRNCKDKFCVNCYEQLHQKGKRKTHSWENVMVDNRMIVVAYDANNNNINNNNVGVSTRRKFNNFSATSGTDDDSSQNRLGGQPFKRTAVQQQAKQSQQQQQKKANDSNDWEEFYDQAARAKYWYNKKTGEASWVSPFQS